MNSPERHKSLLTGLRQAILVLIYLGRGNDDPNLLASATQLTRFWQSITPTSSQDTASPPPINPFQ